MKQPTNHIHMATSPSETHVVLNRRRRFIGHVVLGSAAALVLSACGGGGGGSGEDNSRNLRAALDRLAAGMNTEQVIAAVGWPPNDGSTAWRTDDEYLDVTLSSNDDYTDDVIRSSFWTRGPQSIRRFY